ncbi:hypothetical protein Thiosp_02076 [Thiorhodovibrio litoralis]|nr:hypothetical protein Thiosp_02076 [Thiorhodovibrio litoralis]
MRWRNRLPEPCSVERCGANTGFETVLALADELKADKAIVGMEPGYPFAQASGSSLMQQIGRLVEQIRPRLFESLTRCLGFVLRLRIGRPNCFFIFWHGRQSPSPPERSSRCAPAISSSKPELIDLELSEFTALTINQDCPPGRPRNPTSRRSAMLHPSRVWIPPSCTPVSPSARH